MALPLSRLRSASPEALQKLQDAGIETIDQFYNLAAHKDTRATLAEKTGIPDASLEAWASEADNILLIAAMMQS